MTQQTSANKYLSIFYYGDEVAQEMNFLYMNVHMALIKKAETDYCSLNWRWQECPSECTPELIKSTKGS